MSEIKVDTVAEKTSANGVTVDGLNIKDSKLVTANSVVTSNVTDLNITSGKIADDAITLAKMASGTDGNIISYDASGNPVAIATGNDGQVLTSTGAGSPPAFETLSTGKVLQVQSSSITSTASSSTTSIVSFMNLSITPSSTSNKIFCLYQGTGYANGHNNTLLVRLFRGTISGTQLAQTAIADGNNDYEGYAFGLSKLDSPSTTSAQQYTIGFGATQALYHNMGFSSNNHTLTLMEIAG